MSSNGNSHGPPRTPAEVLEAIEQAAIDDAMDEIGAMSQAEVDAALRAAGADPGEIGARALLLVEELSERRARLDWQASAR